ncbi:T9SS type A sorting domain-containing protein [Pontibacter sp. G13]|uniref:T9SS type A sorting domain-containing protein n=1 Tax=Pontibacter sp. G13 TaxID=3074898 RepID=UPI00288AF177|nr:T9SS type A sorting domain-containing protein [Pontibacter sp. G13]WNJ19328.1 T9SS type A sorting domain-containing protein [Pontibacter sp. G13]
MRILSTLITSLAFVSFLFSFQAATAQCDGGTVTTFQGQDTAYYCIAQSDGNPFVLQFSVTGNTGNGFAYVVTDTNLVILGLPPADMVDFTDAGPGECLVWGVGYTGSFTAQVGDTVGQVDLTDSCFDVSDAAVSVFRDSLEGGTLTLANGDTVLYTCPGDSIADLVTYSTTGYSLANYTYVVTNVLGEILALPDTTTIDLEGAGVGVCIIYGFAYSGELVVDSSNLVGDLTATGCYEISDNSLAIIRGEPLGGMVMTTDSQTTVVTCPGDGEPDVIAFMENSLNPANYTWIVTDDSDVVLEVAPSNFVDFEQAPPGVCRVYGFAYTGTIDVMAGMNIDSVSSDECFALSGNFITVDRDTASCTTSIFPEFPAQQVVLSPNPSNGFIQVEMTLDRATEATWEIMDLQGKIFHQATRPVQAGKHTETFNLTRLAAGMYILRISNDEGISQFRFVIQ